MLQMSEHQGEVLYSRYNDGARPVRVLDDGWEVLREGKLTKFTTAQGLLKELTGHPTGRHWSLERYFGLGAHAPKADKLIGQANVLDLFAPTQPAAPTDQVTLLEPLAPAILGFRQTDTAISVPSSDSRKHENRVSRRSKNSRAGSDLIISGPVGIDLVNRAHEVRKLLFAGFGPRIFASGYDADDVLQEVYRKLLAANRGRSPWDPSKSSFGHYVYMVCGSALSNYHRKQRRIRQFEQSGLASYNDGQWQVQDAASNITIPARETIEQSTYLFEEVQEDLADFILDQHDADRPEARLAIDVLPYVVNGTRRSLIAEALEVSPAAISRAISYLRKAAKAWRASFN